MNDMERRALIGAAGIGAIAALSKAGPLNPPAGAVASTGRTTDEIYNKIATPPAIGGYDGRTPIPGGTTAFTITQPGSYILTGNRALSTGNALTISAANVTLDLNGFRVSTGDTVSAPVVDNTSSKGVTIRNGQVAGGGTGIGFSLSTENCLVEDVLVTDCRYNGISFTSQSNGLTVRRCTVTDIGAATTAGDLSAVVLGIYAGTAYGARIEDCLIARLSHNGGGSMRGISLQGNGCSIIGCTVVNAAATASAIGLLMGTGGVYRSNNVQNFTTKYSGGTDGGGNV